MKVQREIEEFIMAVEEFRSAAIAKCGELKVEDKDSADDWHYWYGRVAAFDLVIRHFDRTLRRHLGDSHARTTGRR